MTLVFLKLGGSLITDKSSPYTARMDIIHRVAGELSTGLRSNPELRLLIGHGSGSFGHVPAAKYRTLQGVHTPAEWSGFQEVWREASALHHILMEALSAAGLPVLSFPPSAEVITDRRSIVEWNLNPIRMALNQNLIPVVYGDVTFDRTQGGTILSTEDVFRHLADRLIPAKIFLAGVEEGIWLDFPQRTKLLPTLNLRELNQLSDSLQGSEAVDVTGGMADKVHQMAEVLKVHPQMEIHIFSGLIPGRIEAALRGEAPGTKMEADR